MIIVYTQSNSLHQSLGSVTDAPVTIVKSSEDLIRHIVAQPGLAIMVLDIRTLDADWEKLLCSLVPAFNLLRIYLVLQADQIPEEGVVVGRRYRFQSAKGNPEEHQHHVIGYDNSPDDIDWGFLRQITAANRRAHQRFEWPIQGKIRPAIGTVKSYAVRSISASGAFFENSGEHPGLQNDMPVEIRFAQFNLRTQCQTLAQRPAQGQHPAGFGIQFNNLTDISKGILDTMVNDALLSNLLETLPKD
jgi:hypothetical protein